jgi:hypothetical protein
LQNFMLKYFCLRCITISFVNDDASN